MFNTFDKVLQSMNSDAEINKKYVFKYSTPNEYYDAVKKCHFTLSKTKVDDPDLFPYLDKDDGSPPWVGFFTSRAQLKKDIVSFNN